MWSRDLHAGAQPYRITDITRYVRGETESALEQLPEPAATALPALQTLDKLAGAFLCQARADALGLPPRPGRLHQSSWPPPASSRFGLAGGTYSRWLEEL